MPFVLIIAGTVLLVAATRNTQATLYQLLVGDFTGPNNFVYWFLSIIVIGAIGYVPRLKPLSEGFMILVILVLFLSKGTGFFDQFQAQIKSTETATSSTTGGSFAPAIANLSPGGFSLMNIWGLPGGPTILT